MQEKRQEAQTSGEGLGAGTEEEAGPRALDVRPTPTAPTFPLDLAWLSCSRSREILVWACMLGRGAPIVRQMGTRTQLEKHSRESRGQSQ